MDYEESRNIFDRLVSVLQRHPEGISITNIRTELELQSHEQQHLDRRIRDLKKKYVISNARRGREHLYILNGLREALPDEPHVSKTTRARIIHFAGERCQMCGRTVIEDRIKLHIDHRIPQAWGGQSEDDNLWTLCSECNEGKKNFFSNITDSRIQQAMIHEQIHVRLGELLKAFEGEPVPKQYLQIVAHSHDDFVKRLRELREIGWEYSFSKKSVNGRVRTFFTLSKWQPWSGDPVVAIRKAEAEKTKKRKD